MRVACATTLLCAAAGLAGADGFINFETAPVHPVELGPDGRALAVCNLPDGRVELFDLSTRTPQLVGSVPVGMPDRDLAIIDTATLDVRYATGLMNICMNLAVNPVSGNVTVIGTDATNERRFEPLLRGTFLRVNLASVNPSTLATTVIDLNPHLDYSTSSVPQSVRDLSLGDPRGIVWNASGRVSACTS